MSCVIYIPIHESIASATPIMFTLIGPILSESAPKGRAPMPNRSPDPATTSESIVKFSENSYFISNRIGGIDSMQAWL